MSYVIGFFTTLGFWVFLRGVFRFFNPVDSPKTSQVASIFPTSETLQHNAPREWDKAMVGLLTTRVVRIKLGNAIGSGFILDERHILTAHHVIDNGDPGLIRFDGPLDILPHARVAKLWTTKTHDLALLILAEPLKGKWPPVEVAFPQTVSRQAFGFSLRQWMWMRNQVERHSEDPRQQKFGSSDCHWIPGDSGSALLTENGELAAVVVLAIKQKDVHVIFRDSNQGPSLKVIRGFLAQSWPPMMPATARVVDFEDARQQRTA